MERGWYRASCLSLKEVLDNRSGSSYYHGDKIIIIPDNFFKKIAEENEKLQKYGAEPVKALDRIKHSYETAMADTDNRLLTQTNAKTSRSKKTMTPEEAKRILEEEAAKSAATK